MNRLSFISLLTVGLTGFAVAQGDYNFQQISVEEGFIPTAVNNSGSMLGYYSGISEMWTQQYGLTQIVSQAGDTYLSSISESGRVYGNSNGSIIRFDPFGGRQTIVSDPNTNFSLISSNDQDNLLLRGVSSSGTKYYVYSLNGLKEVNVPSTGFNPSQILRDGTILGLVPDGSSPGGDLAFTTAKLNSDGTTTVMPHAGQIYNYSNPYGSGYTSQSFGQLANGLTFTRTSSYAGQISSSNSVNTVTVYKPNGESLSVAASNYSSHVGGFLSGFSPAVVLNDGTMIGREAYQYHGNRLYSFANPTGIDMDASFFAMGSAIPDTIAVGTSDGMMVGYTSVDGHVQYYQTKISNVPEPASVAALALGALALLRRNRKRHVG